MPHSDRVSRTLFTVLSLILLFSLSGALTAQEAPYPMINVDNRHTTSLNGDWKVIIDPYQNGYYSYRYTPRGDGYFMNAKAGDKRDLVEYNFDSSGSLQVPGDWNTQREALFFYEGTVWYKQEFDYELEAGKRLFLYFGAANKEATVWLNGEELGRHVGGFTPFSFEITDRVKEEGNFVVVKVDNIRKRDAVPTMNSDWWNYGGITRRVELIETSETYIYDYTIQLDEDRADRIEGTIQLAGSKSSSQNVRLQIDALNVDLELTPDENGVVRFSAPAQELELWSPGNPVLYTVELTTGGETLTDQIGFRTIETRGTDILLNGEPVFFRGISIHEEAPFQNGGRAHSPEQARILLGWAKEMGANFVRLAHYPHNEYMVREAEKMGLMVWSEIPVYWTILFDNAETYAKAETMLEEMIHRDQNRAAVVIWSVGNETPRGGDRLRFMGDLAEHARTLDPTRLITAATELEWDQGNVTINDPLGEYLDVIGANEYLGWYDDRRLEDIPNVSWKTEFDKPLIISEFGAGTKYNYHADRDTRWSEEYQEFLYEKQIELLSGIDFVKGMSPWILMDFRSPRRPLPEIQDWWNRKGLISEHGEKKKAFYVMQKYYNSLK